jgi:YgiT-type zinc finger domain-containing protein
MGMLDDIRRKIGRRQYEMQETIIDTEVTYTMEHAGKFYIVEHVPARVCRETGEQYFSPETVEHIQSLIKSRKKPDKLVETPVYEYA